MPAPCKIDIFTIFQERRLKFATEIYVIDALFQTGWDARLR